VLTNDAPTFANRALGDYGRARVLVRTTTHYHYQRQRNGKSSRRRSKVTSTSIASIGAFWGLSGQDSCFLVAGVLLQISVRLATDRNGYESKQA